MRFTIFWRVLLAQISLIVLILALSLYALSHLHQLTRLSTEILATDSAAIAEEKRLLKIFLAQMRMAEKYLLLRDKVFYSHFTQGSGDFEGTLQKTTSLLDTPQERGLLEQVKGLHARYATGLTAALSPKSTWDKEKTAISDGIIGGINELIRLREGAVGRKVAAARDQASSAAGVMGWLTLGGISAAVLLAYVHARGVGRPLRKLAQELRRVGTGEFHRSLHIRAPKEVSELAQAFNWMAARLAELDQMKADFIANVSHELRTPLTAIQEGTALLRDEIPGPLTASQREILAVVQGHSERLFRGLCSVLDLSKMEAGMLEYAQVPSDLPALIERSLETVRLLAQKKRIHLEVTDVATLPLLSLDEGRIQQVLDNLLSNAVKFTLEGGTIQVSASFKGEGDVQGSLVEVRVSDTGVGIPTDDVERIFDKFYQSPYHRGESLRGTGLGLAIARHIVEAHGGSIWAESRLGEGATFIFTLPTGGKDTHEAMLGASSQQRGRGGVMLGGMLLLALLLAGCTASLPLLAPPSPSFPPQQVMAHGNYAGFLAENKQRLERCGKGTGCEVALFNLGFVHAYPQSPYRDPTKALHYFDELRKKYPQSPWAAQGQAWVALIQEIRTRETMIRSLRVQLKRSRDIDIEMEKKERELSR